MNVSRSGQSDLLKSEATTPTVRISAHGVIGTVEVVVWSLEFEPLSEFEFAFGITK
jgi:hypothetical protein